VKVSLDNRSDSYYAVSQPETALFMSELMELCRKYGLVLVPQNSDYDAFVPSEPMRVVPLTEELEKDIARSSVCFEE